MLSAIALITSILGVAALFYMRRSRDQAIKHSQEIEKRDRELKQQVLELQVLRSLGERAGYSLDIRQILDVIVDSLEGVVEFSAISYLLLGPEGRVISKIRVVEPVSHQFLISIREQVRQAFSQLVGQKVQPQVVDETLSGIALDDIASREVGSFFNLPLTIGGKIVALINVSSFKKGLYGQEETAVLYTILEQVSASATKLSQVVENEKRKLSAMISSLDDGVMMVDRSFNLMVTNPTLSRLLNLRGEPSLFNVAVAVDGKANLHDVMQRVLQHEQAVKLSEFEVDGNAIQIDVEPVKDKSGYLLGAVVILHDMTAQRQLERLREEFTAMMVHELRTPLTTVIYSTDMMKSDLPKMGPQEVEQNLAIIRSTTDNMLSLVNELLDIAKMEAGKFEVTKKEDDPKQLIEEKVATFKPLTDQKHLQLIAEIDPNISHLSFDRKRIGQALDNLLSNAIKYTDKGQVIIKAVSQGEEVLISVSDTGDGITPEDKDKLFSKFEQLGKGKTGERGGTGLGLVVTKGIIEAHGGKIWVDSPGLGQGTTFTFSLPLK